MSAQQLVEHFEGTPVSQLGWWDLIRYNAALTSLNVYSSAYVTGNTPCGLAEKFGITWEQVQTGPTEKE